MRFTWPSICRVLENHSRLFVITVLFLMTICAFGRVIAYSADLSRQSEFMFLLERVLLIVLGWWAAFASSSLALRLAAWLGGLASLLAVPVQRFAVVAPNKEWSDFRWIISFGTLPFVAVSGIVALLAFVLCRWLLAVGGIRLTCIEDRPLGAYGKTFQWWPWALDALILAAVLVVVAGVFYCVQPYDDWLRDGIRFLLRHPGFSSGILAWGTAEGLLLATLGLGVAWFLLGEAGLPGRTVVLLAMCFVYVAVWTVAVRHFAESRIAIADVTAGMVKLCAISGVVFALLRFGGYRLQKRNEPRQPDSAALAVLGQF